MHVRVRAWRGVCHLVVSRASRMRRRACSDVGSSGVDEALNKTDGLRSHHIAVAARCTNEPFATGVREMKKAMEPLTEERNTPSSTTITSTPTSTSTTTSASATSATTSASVFTLPSWFKPADAGVEKAPAVVDTVAVANANNNNDGGIAVSDGGPPAGDEFEAGGMYVDMGAGGGRLH